MLPEPAAQPRVPTLDVLRGVAILAMLIAHGVPFLWPTGVSRPVEVVLGGINALASPLFGLAMGAAAALVWARPGMREGWPRRVLTDLGRGVVVFALGMLLVELNTWVAIVLHVLGVLMVIGVPVAALAGMGARGRDGALWALGALTAALFVIAPWVTGTVAPAEDRLFNGTTGGVSEVWAAFIAGTSYRAVSLLPFFALGALLAATGLLSRPRALAVWSAPVAALLVALRLVGVLEAGTLSGDVMDQAWDLSLVAGAAALVAVAVGVGGTVLESSWRPVAELGAIALSVYALQLVVLRPLMAWDAWLSSAALGWAAMAVLVVVPSVLMLTWRRLAGPGPLERLVALVTGKGRAT